VPRCPGVPAPVRTEVSDASAAAGARKGFLDSAARRRALHNNPLLHKKSGGCTKNLKTRVVYLLHQFRE
jgi:hypothetical protein